MKSFRYDLFFKCSQLPRCCEDGAPRPVQGTSPAAQPAAIHTRAIPAAGASEGTLPQSTARNVQNNELGDTQLLLVPGEFTEERAHAHISKDLKNKEIQYTKTSKDSGSNTVAAGMGFL